jgi:phosphopantothenoylcysteine decarboxylase / phosphopantothenate---cysteine ligase
VNTPSINSNSDNALSDKSAQPLRIVLGISGGIAAYKMPQLIRMLKAEGVDVRVVLSPSAKTLVGIEALHTVSGHPVSSDDLPAQYDMDHIRLAEWADFFVVCPATANTIAKLAGGIADNLLTTVGLCFEKKLLIVPAMNTAMWCNTATQTNVALLRSRGATVLDVDKGELACGAEGQGRLAPLETIVRAVANLRTPLLLAGKRVLIASGPTEEPIDSVRVITNRSSGKMGAALADAAMAMGAAVTVVSGPAAVDPPSGARCIPVKTAREMLAAMDAEFASADAVIMVAAVADYRVAEPSSTKIHREGQPAVSLDLVSNPDIAATLGAKKSHQVMVGFSLDDTENVDGARRKMIRKGCDLMIVNAAETSIGRDDTIAVILDKNKSERLGPLDKKSLALEILRRVALLTESADG